MKKTIKVSALVLTMAALTSIMSPVSLAHVVIRPAQVGIGAHQTFTVGVPNEKDVPTTGLRVLVPEGVTSVMPNVKPGWNIQTKTSGDDDNQKVTEIVWSNGSIPVGQRDEFYFSAKTPTSESTIVWKAYQTYADGEVVAWDQSPEDIKRIEEEKKASSAPETESEHAAGPYSQTAVVNDLVADTASTTGSTVVSQDKTSQLMAGLALVVSFAAVALGLRKK